MVRRSDFVSSLIFIYVFLIFLGFRFSSQVNEMAAIQRLQLKGYSEIVVVKKITVAAWWRSDCTFPQTVRIELTARRTDNVTEAISLCINDFTGSQFMTTSPTQ